MKIEFEAIAENVWRAKGAPRKELALFHPEFCCPSCGRAVTDEAMNIVMERLRELKKWTT